MRTTRNEALYDRMLGALVGVAVGDALGGPLERMTAEEILQEHGVVSEMLGGGWLNLGVGEVTDDTDMTMCVARGIAKDPSNPVPAIGQNFVAWQFSGPVGIGTTCRIAIEEAVATRARSREDWLRVGRTIGRERLVAGNGALMRTIYPALYYHAKEKRQRMVRFIGRMTHYNIESEEICVEYAEAVHAALFGAHPITTITPKYFIPCEEPSGYVVDTWYHAMDAVLSFDNFEDILVDAVNRGGDADTVGAIAGGLAGAYYGFKAIPERWVAELDPELLEEMRDLAELALHEAEDYYR